MKKGVVLFGKGDLAIRIARWFHNSPNFELIEVVPVIPEPKWSKSLVDWCIKNNVAYVKSGDYKDLRVFNKKDIVDLGFSVFYEKIFPPWFIGKFRKIVNLHNGPLPKYRGVAPINWSLKNNEFEHGATIHEILPGIDNGPIIAQLKYSIYPDFDEVVTVYKRALNYGWVLFKETIQIMDLIKPRRQSETKASYYSLSDKKLLGERSDFTKQKSLKEHGR